MNARACVLAAALLALVGCAHSQTRLQSADDTDKDIIFSTLLYNNIYRLKKEAEDLIVIDPIEYFLKAEQKNQSIPLMADHFHLTLKGNELFANFIADRIEKTIEEKKY